MNMIKHAAATKASIKLVINKKDIVLRVMDNGIGFNVKNMDKDVGIGLSSIKTKLHLLKGELDISSKQGKGTVINIRLPSQLAEGS